MAIRPVPSPNSSPGAAKSPLSVAGLGQCSLDTLCLVPAFPPPDTKCECRELLTEGGGPVATALVLLARWGVSTRFAGVVGDDECGKKIIGELVREKVDTSAMVCRPGGHSQTAFIVVERNTGRRTIFWRRPDKGSYRPGEVPEGFLDGVQALHLDGLFATASISLARRARRLHVPVVLDAGSLRPGMMDLIRHTDHLIASEGFSRHLRPRGPRREVLFELKQLGPRVVTITLGAAGSVSLCGDRMVVLPALRIRSRDTTGAGDVFHGAYIYGLIRGWAPAAGLLWATVSAGLSCTVPGGRSGIPRLSSVSRQLRLLKNWDQGGHPRLRAGTASRQDSGKVACKTSFRRNRVSKNA